MSFALRNLRLSCNTTILTDTGGGAYWAGRAVARPLFAVNGQAM